MPVSAAQMAAFADKHAYQIPFDTSPRHLAGPGDARHVTHGLAAAGWKRVSDPLSPEIVLRSPDTRYNLNFDPQTSFSSWWRLHAHATDTEPGWYASFGEHVPAELICALTDALLGPPPAEQPDPFEAVKAAGWRYEPGNEQAASPDGMCHAEREHRTSYLRDDERDWLVETCEPGYDEARGRLLWRARFNYRTPAHLVGAFVTALADIAPLQRGMDESTAHYSVAQVASPLTPEQVVAAHADRLDGIRTQVRATRRRRQPSTPPSAPTTSTSATRRR